MSMQGGLNALLKEGLHDRYKLGQSNQISLHFQLWEDLNSTETRYMNMRL